MRLGHAAKATPPGTLHPWPALPGDFDEPADHNWHYVGTLDNDATNTELHFLARLSAALPGHDGDPYRAGFLRGMRYLLNAQFPNGGWPQVWPLEGGYHDAITFNDDAVTESAELLTDAATGQRITTRPTPEDASPELATRREASDAATLGRGLHLCPSSAARTGPQCRGEGDHLHPCRAVACAWP